MVTTTLDPRFSAPDVDPTDWLPAREQLAQAEVYWLSTVRPDGRPHVTPLIGVWWRDALHFCTGPDERKARNLADNPQCVLTTGTNALDEGMDIVVEGTAEQVTDAAALRSLSIAYEAKYGSDWHFDVRDSAFANAEGGRALVFRVAPTVGFGFAKGEYGQTKWRF